MPCIIAISISLCKEHILYTPEWLTRLSYVLNISSNHSFQILHLLTWPSPEDTISPSALSNETFLFPSSPPHLPPFTFSFSTAYPRAKRWYRFYPFPHFSQIISPFWSFKNTSSLRLVSGYTTSSSPPFLLPSLDFSFHFSLSLHPNSCPHSGRPQYPYG